MKSVLVVDDDIELAQLLNVSVCERFKNAVVDIASDPFEAMNMMADKAYDLVLLDWNLPGITGLRTLEQASKDFDYDPNLPSEWREKRTPVVVMSADDEEQCKAHSTRYFSYAGFVNKKLGLGGIMDQVNQHLVLVH